MEKRHAELSELHDFIEGVDKEVEIVLQDLKWNRKRFLEDVPKVNCCYEKSHKIAPDKMECHERQCFLKSHGYDKDILLPDPLDADANTLIKLDKQAIITIINNASCGNPLFKQECPCMINLYFPVVIKTSSIERKCSMLFGIRSQSPEPWTLERLQASYTMDERRAIHDAVVQAVPSCHDLADLALPSNEDGAENPNVKSRAEILAELRDMKRRRAKYRVAAKTRKYSDVLRDVIKTQMELYTDSAHETKRESDRNEPMPRQKGKNQYTDDYENGVPSSLKDNGRRQSQDQYSPGNFSSRNRNIDRSIPAERVRSHSMDRGRRQRDYYLNSYAKNRDRTVPSSAEDRERGECSTSRFERRRAENRANDRSKYESREESERQLRNYTSSSMRDKNKEEAREHNRRDEYANTSRYDVNNDKHSGQSKEYYTAPNKPRKRHGENYTSSERHENPSKRRHKEIRNRNSYEASRKRNAGRDGVVRVKIERDKTADRDLSDNETRYDYVYTSWYKNKHISSNRDKSSRDREKYYHKSGHRRGRDEDDVPIKQERQTPEPNEVDTQSNYTRTSTYISTRRNDYTSSSESDDTNSKRDRRTMDNYEGQEQINVRIKRERSDTPEDGYDRRISKRHRQKHSHRYSSWEDSDSSSSITESESRRDGRYETIYPNDRIEETCRRIKKEKNATPPKDDRRKEVRHNQYSKNVTQEHSDTNSSWE